MIKKKKVYSCRESKI